MPPVRQGVVDGSPARASFAEPLAAPSLSSMRIPLPVLIRIPFPVLIRIPLPVPVLIRIPFPVRIHNPFPVRIHIPFPALPCPPGTHTTPVSWARDDAAAVPLEEVLPVDAPRTLIVLDGTWTFARNMYAKNADRFAPLRKVTLNMAGIPPSEYMIRKQPREGCLCTLEAVAHAVAILEDDPTIVDVRTAQR